MENFPKRRQRKKVVQEVDSEFSLIEFGRWGQDHYNNKGKTAKNTVCNT